jgi:hypothetical protein
MMLYGTQALQRDGLQAGIADVIDAARRSAVSLDERRMAWQPPDGGWSAGTVFEHLVVANAAYLEVIRAAVRRPGAPRRSGAAAPWKPSLAGWMLIRGLDPAQQKRRFRAPRIFQPGAAPRAGVVDAFVAGMTELAALVREAESLDWRRVRTSSPVNRWIRLNLGDCFTVVVVHAQRHLGQIDRLRSKPGFPPAGAGAG